MLLELFYRDRSAKLWLYMMTIIRRWFNTGLSHELAECVVFMTRAWNSVAYNV